jgi:hypothetical protein
MSRIVVVISVDWEGRSLLPENLQLIAAFRRKHPAIPFQHFLNPAYYTRPGVDEAHTTAAIRQALLPGDEHGLHIHAWHSLLAAVGVDARDEPRFLDGDPAVPKAPDDWGFYPPEKGYDVPLESFASAELDRMLAIGREILITHGFERATSFRAGGWMCGPKVQAALVRNGFAFDCSAVDPQLSIRRFGDIPLNRWLLELWPMISETSQPYELTTAAGPLWEIPNNAGLVDYTSTEDLENTVLRSVARWREAPDRPRIISTGFHQETARRYLDRLEHAIGLMRRLAEQQSLPLMFTAHPPELLAFGFP